MAGLGESTSTEERDPELGVGEPRERSSDLISCSLAHTYSAGTAMGVPIDDDEETSDVLGWALLGVFPDVRGVWCTRDSSALILATTYSAGTDMGVPRMEHAAAVGFVRTILGFGCCLGWVFAISTLAKTYSAGKFILTDETMAWVI